MKLLDRYLVKSLLVPLGYCLSAFVVLIVVQDLFEHLDNFVEAKTPILQVLFYYGLLMPSVLVLIVPVSLLLAVLYSLLQLAKNNELTAMRASGVSLYRLMTPFLLVGLAFTVLVAVVHETIGPRFGHWAIEFIEYQEMPEGAHIDKHVALYNTRDSRDWHMQTFNTKTFEMNKVQITETRGKRHAQTKMNAERAEWLDGAWVLFSVDIQDFDEHGDPVQQFDEAGQPVGIVRRVEHMEMRKYRETPQDFINVSKPPEFMSSPELYGWLKANQEASASTTAPKWVDLHARLAMPWMAFIVTILGIPFGNQAARKGALTGILLSMGLFFGYYFMINFGIWLGKGLMIPAWLAAWAPNLIFLTVGVVLVYRMR